MPRFLRPLPCSVALLSVALALPAAVSSPLRFDFAPAGTNPAPGHTLVTPETRYAREPGYGFEPGPALSASAARTTASTSPDPAATVVTAAAPFHFTARVPAEGNWRVTVTLGDPAAASTTTIKAELRRLMVAESIAVPAGAARRVTFIVNTRTPRIAATDTLAAGEVRLKAPRETVQEAWAWDDVLTLEFFGPRPAVAAVELEPADVPTVYLLGDSTVCDQSKEPYASWGQMLTRFFAPTVAIANHGESGETYRDSLARRRLDKIVSLLRPDDWLLLQFGHNDQKQIAAGTGGPFTTYKDELRRHVAACRARGATPVILSPMERRGFDADGKVRPSLADYATAARQSASELGAAFIDLNALSRTLYEALGPEASARAFATPGGKVDNTHHNNFGAHQLAQCIAAAIRAQGLPLAAHLAPDFRGYDPARPDSPDTFAVPASGEFTNQRPLGDEPNK